MPDLAPDNRPPTIDPELLSILVCPVTRSRLEQRGDQLVATQGGLHYPIEDGIPILLPERAILPDDIPSMDEFRRRHAAIIP